MPLILAIEPDRKQASKVRVLTDTLGVELVVGETTEEALGALGSRTPDLVLTSQLLSPKDEAALADRLRELDAAGAHAPTLVIPVLQSEERERKKSSGLFGRLRRGHEEAATPDGCEPAVFGREIAEYLERSAADRAAVAAAQADLEAAWADAAAADSVRSHDALAATSQAALDPTDNGTNSEIPFGSVDVHPGMVVEDPEALFGEFAAIPIGRSHPAAPGAALEPALEELDEGVSSFESSSDETTDRHTPPVEQPAAALDEELPLATLTNEPPPDEEWEEIALDPVEHRVSREREVRPSTHHVELADAAVEDLDAFVRELATAKSTANAQPMIPIVDLSGVVTSGAETPEAAVVSEMQLQAEARALFEAEVLSAFALPEQTLSEPADPTATDTAAIGDTAEPWRAELDLLPSAPPIEREAAPAHESSGKPAWGDLLSAIQRDIEQTRVVEDAAPDITRSKTDFSTGSLVFPARQGVSPHVIAAIESGSAERVRTPSSPELAPAPDVAEPAAALSALLQSVSASDLRVSEVETINAMVPADEELATTDDPHPEPLAPQEADAPVEPAAQFVWEGTVEECPDASTNLANLVADSIGAAAPGAAADGPRESSLESSQPDVLAWLVGGAPAAEAQLEPESAEPVGVVNEPAAPHSEEVSEPVHVSFSPRHHRSKSRKKRKHAPAQSPATEPTMGDWGFIDPQRLGFGALVARLNEIAGTGDGVALR